MILSLVNFEYIVYSVWICSCNKVTVRGKTSKLDLYRYKKPHKRTRHRFFVEVGVLNPQTDSFGKGSETQINKIFRREDGGYIPPKTVYKVNFAKTLSRKRRGIPCEAFFGHKKLEDRF